MENINKLFLILENLKYEDNETETSSQLIQQNLEVIRKYIKQNLNEIYEQTLVEIKCPIPSTASSTSSDSWTYVCYLFHILLKILKNVNFESDVKEDLISLRHMNDFTKACVDVSRYGVRLYLNTALRQHFIFKLRLTLTNENQKEHLEAGLNFLELILKIKLIALGNIAGNSIVLDAMAGIYTMFIENYNIEQYKKFLNYLWENTSKENYFKNLLILKSVTQLPPFIQNKLHNDLLEKLLHDQGFNILVHNMIEQSSSSKQKDDIQPSWERYDVIARIIAHPSHNSEFIEKIIEQIFNFIFLCLRNEDELLLIGAGIVTLRKLSLTKQEYKIKIENKIDEYLKKLYNPQDILTGIIIMENSNFKILINFFFTSFCISSMKSLPSELLIKYVLLFMNLYNQLPNDTIEQGQLKSVIVQCLANRQKSELQSIIKDFFILDWNDVNNEFHIKYKILHPRILINFNEKFQMYTLQIAPPELQYTFDISNVLSKILKQSNNNIFIYNVFIIILNLLDENDFEDNSNENLSKIDLIQNEDELNEFISYKFKTKLSIVTFLTDLITFKSFHSQFHENPQEILQVIRNFIKTRLKYNKFNNENNIDHNLSIVLAIFQEFLEQSKDTSMYKDFLGILKELIKNIKNIAIKHQIETIINLIDGGPINFCDNLGQSKYNFARSLLNEQQSHLKVYGITQIIKLINDKNEEVLANKHAILALALHVLKDEESYTYLNCIRLLVALTMILESEVLEMLSSEYLNKDEKIEFRLKIGESILKVTEDLGPLAYKYKGILINCFLHGSKQTENEFRASSLSNLATVCRLLSYQVYNFFQELLIVIDSILQTDKYLPSRRAAVMVLSQLLFGMDNLIDFQDYLLPLYRYLKYIIENDKDDITRIHATNGLKSLNDKCKSFLLPQQNYSKEIKIFGIKDEENNKKKTNILEI